jgi:hypothetical protein
MWIKNRWVIKPSKRPNYRLHEASQTGGSISENRHPECIRPTVGSELGFTD